MLVPNQKSCEKSFLNLSNMFVPLIKNLANNSCHNLLTLHKISFSLSCSLSRQKQQPRLDIHIERWRGWPDKKEDSKPCMQRRRRTRRIRSSSSRRRPRRHTILAGGLACAHTHTQRQRRRRSPFPSSEHRPAKKGTRCAYVCIKKGFGGREPAYKTCVPRLTLCILKSPCTRNEV